MQNALRALLDLCLYLTNFSPLTTAQLSEHAVRSQLPFPVPWPSCCVAPSRSHRPRLCAFLCDCIAR